MRSALLVAWREYAENAKTKGFWIGIFLLPLILTISFTVQRYLEEATPTRHFVLVDPSGEFRNVVRTGLERRHEQRVLEALEEYVRVHSAVALPQPDWIAALQSEGLERALELIAPALNPDAPAFEEPRRRFVQVPLPPEVAGSRDLPTLADRLKPYLRGEKKYLVDGREIELFAALLVPDDIARAFSAPHPNPAQLDAEPPKVQYWSINLADDELRGQIEDLMNGEVRRRLYVARGMDAETVRGIQRTELPFTNLDPKKREGQEEVRLADVLRQWSPIGLVYLLWIAIFTVSQMLLNNTIEEKSNRIIEVLLSSVTAGELMLGKLLGIAGVGLTMLGAWIGAAFVVLSFHARNDSEVAVQLFHVLAGSGLLPAFAIYFLLGYLMYSGIFLSIGSICNTLKEAQNLMGPVMLVMVIPLFTMFFIPKDPNGTLATIMSWIPLYTPFVMMNRAAADPPLFDVIGTMLLLLCTTILVLWLSGKIFRAGILRTGQPPKLLELLRWLRS